MLMLMVLTRVPLCRIFICSVLPSAWAIHESCTL